jgi:hypothetical protein
MCKVASQVSWGPNLSVKENDDIVNWLFADDPKSRQESFSARCCPDTGGWFLKKFREWILEPDSKLLLCSGMRISYLLIVLMHASWSGQVIFNAWPQYSQSHKVRSIVIDYLWTRPNIGIPVFYYFSNDEKADDKFPTQLVSSLIKQLVIWTGNMPKRLSTTYKSGRKRPNLEQTIDIFKEYCENLQSNVYVLFDGLDECVSDYHQDVVSLIQQLNASGIRVYITMRDFLVKDPLVADLNVEPLRITAQVDDVKKFVELRLKKRVRLTTNAQSTIVQKIADGTNGM